MSDIAAACVCACVCSFPAELLPVAWAPSAACMPCTAFPQCAIESALERCLQDGAGEGADRREHQAGGREQAPGRQVSGLSCQYCRFGQLCRGLGWPFADGAVVCSVNRCLEENRELTNRLINIAFQNEDDIFDAAFGEGSGGGAKADRAAAPPPLDTSQVQRRQKEIAEQVRRPLLAPEASRPAPQTLHRRHGGLMQTTVTRDIRKWNGPRESGCPSSWPLQMRLAEEQQKRDEVRREELSARASNQVQRPPSSQQRTIPTTAKGIEFRSVNWALQPAFSPDI